VTFMWKCIVMTSRGKPTKFFAFDEFIFVAFATTHGHCCSIATTTNCLLFTARITISGMTKS
jgi:hypothetical protein